MNTYKKHLYDLGIPVSLKGFAYLNYALEIFTDGCSVTKIIYPQVAEKFNTTSTRVERAIRHAVNKLGLNITNKEFLARYKMLWEEEQEEIPCSAGKQ